MKYQIVVFLIGAFSASVLSERKIPNYIRTCDNSKPDFKECALENANYAIPFIAKGDKHFGIPNLNPLRLPLIDIEQNNFKISLKDVEIFGLQDLKAKALSLDHGSFEAKFYIENLVIIGTYKLNGRVLVLNLQGEGPANITAVGGTYDVKATLTPYEKNGETYLRFEKPDLQFTVKRAHFDFGNLLNGDQQLGPEINQILNDSWQDLLTDLGAPIRETVSTIIESIVSKILAKVPRNNILPEN